MFITKKHIRRRTLLKGAGVALGLPLLESMFPGRDGVGAGDRGSAAFLRRASCRTARRRATGFPRRKARCPPSCRSSGSRSSRTGKPHDPDGPALDFVRAAARRDRRRPLGRCRVPVRRQAEENRGADVHAGQTIDQIIAAEDRAGRRCCLRGDVGRGSGLGLEQLRRRLQLRLHQHDRVGVADDAVADGAEPAGRVRAHVRQRQHAGAARRAPRAQPEHPRLVNGKIGPSQRDQRSGPVASRQLHGERPRDRASIADRGQGHDRGARGFRRASRHSAVVRRAHQADVRPAGAGVPGRHHARRHVALRARSHGTPLPGKRSSEFGLPWRVASRRGSRR